MEQHQALLIRAIRGSSRNLHAAFPNGNAQSQTVIGKRLPILDEAVEIYSR